MQRRIAVRAIAVHDGKLLCVRLKRYEGAFGVSNGEEWWCLPGGGLETGESLLKGVERELIEETGITPSVGALLYIQQFATPDSNSEHLEFFFHTTNADDYLHIDLSKSSHGQIEIAEIAFVDPAATNILPRFLGTEDINAQINVHEPPKLFDYLTSVGQSD